MAVLHDVTRFKDLDQVKNEFIATASHDLKNPITSIVGFSQLLAQGQVRLMICKQILLNATFDSETANA